MSARKATDIFSEWALNGKDLGMQDHHSTAVDAMLETLTSSRSSSFSFVDAGCGNGWVVRKMSSNPKCTRSFGIDGAEALVPLVESVIQNCGSLGASQLCFGMAHRGRLNLLVNVLGKLPSEFSGQAPSE